MLNSRMWIHAAVLLLAAASGNAAALTDQEQLGRNLFFDTNLSTPAGQGCVSCHDPAFAFTDPDKNLGVSQGVNTTRFGSRNAPTAMYQAFTPDFGFFGGEFTGGQFWDQRAANLTEQAKGPFLNPLEMNNPDKAAVLNKIQNAGYMTLFNQVCGQPDAGNQSDVALKYTCMADAIAAFETTPELNRFSSKFDLYPEDMTVQEKRGLLLFRGKGGCAVCHPLAPIPSRSLFTDTDAHNIGVPGNLGMRGINMTALQNYFPFYFPPLAPEFNPAGLNFVDVGLAGNPNIPLVMRPGVKGGFKVPTLRNVNLTAPYMHNGVFRTLKQVVHFYNTRDLLGRCDINSNPQPGVNCWPAPEVPVNLAPGIGNLELTDAEENDIVEFLNTLTDGYIQEPPTTVLTPQEELGKNLFNDTNLSTPPGQGCVSCHQPAIAFTDPDKDRGVSQGANLSRFGSRNAPSAMYAAFSPDFVLFGAGFIGGQFWDQRAANLTEQAKGPFLNRLEMNNTNEAEVLNKINNSAYADIFNTVCGASPDQYACMASAIAAFENTPELNRFSSKFDLDQTNMTLEEMKGFNLFKGKGKCSLCHPLGPTSSSSIFTDFDAENIGIPSNRGMLGNNMTALQNYFPFYFPPLVPEFNSAGLNFVDTGLGGNPNVPAVMQPLFKGMMKAPTLRNVELTAPYMHNGVFRDLKTVVHFYNTRDVLGNCANATNPQPSVNCWPAPEVLPNMNIVIGNLQLTEAEENEIVLFLKTLTDGYAPPSGASVPTPQEELGKNLFFDTNLSTPQGQGCVSCHDPAAAFTEPHKDRGVSEGAVPGRFGSRNAPSEAYQAFVPDFHLVGAGFIGGQFRDQRAANLTEQAKGPFLAPVEMNNPDETAVLNKIKNASYASLFNTVCGASPDQYTCMADALAAFGKTPELNRFNSKFDIDQENLTVEEMRGFILFNGKAKCAVCHPIAPFGSRSLFTDFDAENIGVPKNLGMMGDTDALKHYYPFYYLPQFNPAGLNFIDVGVAGNPSVPEIMRPTLKGAMKAPSLRNVELTAPYMHNGVFTTLKEVVHFYNTRDILGNCAVRTNPQPGVNCWPAPEVAANLAPGIGNLQLTDAEENDIVAYLLTLTDGYVPQQRSTMKGRITSAATGAPIRTATVTAGQRTALMDTGAYTITNIASGTYTVTASATGFNSSSTTVSIASGAIAVQDFALQPVVSPVIANITDFNVENGARGGTIIANVTVNNLNNVPHMFVVDVSGLGNLRGYPLAATGVIANLNPGQSIRIPVKVAVPPSADPGSYVLYAGVYPFDNEILDPAKLIGNFAGPGTTTVI